MIRKTLKSSINQLNLTTIFSISFSSKPKSYYQILQIDKTFTAKQLKSQFLKKARQLHPDHNPSQKAQQQFKIVKQAYQTLKDPQKRYMYDTGISVQPGQQTQMHQQFKQSSGQKYYQNKWYKYEKSKYKDARDQFYQSRNPIIQENPYRNRVILFLSLVVGVFGYDYYFSRSHKTEMQNKMNKQLLENSVQTKKKAAIMKKYIQTRSKQHIVQD